MKFRHLTYFFFLVIFSILSSCYSFTGSSLSPETQTIQINEFINNAPLNNPQLAQQFSTDIQNRFLQRTTLKGTKENPDILIEGEITDYSITPTTISSSVNAPGGNIQAAQNKLTITVKVHYENRIEPDKSFDRVFSDEAVFASDLDIQQIETAQVKLVNERIINKIFNDIVANW
ncbi:LptE family protein [Chryseobacterium lacus]|uniref:LptE family protein n=1 Tax=Chryseobacterium lacus TaxID=2058346 RepID=UPI000F8604A2|nr:LptE family protein [Chryseobacterium lacus]MBF6611168.1 LptE family protein [Chryseobacterium sp.]RST25669.1 hypothetical protein EIZ46_09690 [Chryseobacterium lacus]